MEGEVRLFCAIEHKINDGMRFMAFNFMILFA
jgi:hypothetical protein